LVDARVTAYLSSVSSPRRRRDADTLMELMQTVTGQEPRMWATVVGFGQYHYRYASGREGDGPGAAFAARKGASTIYLPDGVRAHGDLLAKLGPHSTGVGTIHIKDLHEIDLGTLEAIVRKSYSTLTSGTFERRARESGEAGSDC
jgi:hypothetical protein